MSADRQDMDALVNRKYEAGFVTQIETEVMPPDIAADEALAALGTSQLNTDR